MKSKTPSSSYQSLYSVGGVVLENEQGGVRRAKGTQFLVRRELGSIWGPKCIRMDKQNKVESINEHYYKALGNFSCSEVLDQASDSTDPSQGLENGSQNTSCCCGIKGPLADGKRMKYQKQIPVIHFFRK